MKRSHQIAEFGRKLMSLGKVENILELVSSEAKQLLNADRCSIFIVDVEDKMLWTKLSDGIGRIVISLDSGIVGDTYMKSKPQLVNSPYDDPRFLPNIDKKSGYVTQNIITTPIYNSKREVIGVIQLLNKSRGNFDDKDLQDLAFLANYVSGSLELILMSGN
ncbi:MAG: GAF domain-containing protein [Sulfurimonas sp.]|nr:GAF domain-containing protein [Sulfurimonas sp.]